MPAEPKTITVFLDASPSGDRRAARAAAFAKRWNAHLVGVHVVYKGAIPHPALAYARSEKAIAGVVAHERRIDSSAFPKTIPTQMFNGYSDQVANLYAGMDLKKNY